MGEDGDNESESDSPWRNKNKVKVISIIDVFLGVLLVVLYIYYAFAFMIGGEHLLKVTLAGVFGRGQARFLAFILAIVVLGINVSQVLIALNLFRSVKKHSHEEVSKSPLPLLQSSRLWHRVNFLFLVLLIIKFFILSLFTFGNSNTFDFIFCALEFLFRCIGWYFVQEFRDDLELELKRRGLERRKRSEDNTNNILAGGPNFPIQNQRSQQPNFKEDYENDDDAQLQLELQEVKLEEDDDTCNNIIHE